MNLNILSEVLGRVYINKGAKLSNVEKLQELLGQYCAGGYSSGFYGEANARWVADNYDFVVVSDVYRVGYMACLLSGVTEEQEGILELIEVLEGLDDYPLIDDSYLHELVDKDEQRAVGELAVQWEVAEECVWDALRACDASLDWEQDYVYLASCYEVEVQEVAQKLELVRVTELQTWSAHYNSGEFHTPEVCAYCTEAEVA
jgi:hypothetical protein